MRTRAFFLLPFLFVFAATILAQETATPVQPATPAPPSGPLPASTQADGIPRMPLPPMNPTQLLRMRNDLTFQLQESQRVLSLVGQDDKQLVDLHRQQQKEIVDQLKDIETQLKAQGLSTADPANPGTPPGLPAALPPAQDPTLVPGGMPQPPADPNLLIQRQPGFPTMQTVPIGMPTVPEGFQMYNPAMPPRPIPGTEIPGTGMPGATIPMVQPGMPGAAVPPTGFDQDQAWANSPWVPQPSKELTEMKQTVESLRKEIGELKATVKALETQIQLLNRNILLSQPAAPANP